MAYRTGTSGADKLTGPVNETNILYGMAGNDTLTGGDFNDLLDGGTGADSLAGGLGNDTYVIDNAGDKITEVADPASVDTVRASVSYILPSNVETLLLQGTGNINATGNSQNNQLSGNNGNNILNGGGGADTMSGGLGNDTYMVDNPGDRVSESASAGTDQVNAGINYTLPSNVENLVLTGSATTGTGNDLANTLTGNGLANTLTGAVGNDTLVGNGGADLLDGGLGNDTMAGGVGDDQYIVDSTDDVVSESANGGIDQVTASINYTLSSNVENLVLTGNAVTGTGNGLANSITGNALANTLFGGDGNDTLIGNGGADVLNGGLGDDLYHVNANTNGTIEDTIIDAGGHDFLYVNLVGTPTAAVTIPAGIEWMEVNGSANVTLKGSSGQESLFGNDGNNTIDGGAGADFLYGGLGNDTFIVDNIGDRVGDPWGSGLPNSGIDTVMASVNFDLLAKGNDAMPIENLTLTGNAVFGGGNTRDNIVTGNALDNSLDGYGGNDTLVGGSGDDVLSGGLGADVLTGGSGKDIYVFHVDPSGATDRVTDFVIGTDHFSIAGEWSYQNHVDSAATIRFVQSGTSAVLQMDADLTGPGVTWVGIATFDNQSATALNSQEATLFF